MGYERYTNPKQLNQSRESEMYQTLEITCRLRAFYIVRSNRNRYCISSSKKITTWLTLSTSGSEPYHSGVAKTNFVAAKIPKFVHVDEQRVGVFSNIKRKTASSGKSVFVVGIDVLFLK